MCAAALFFAVSCSDADKAAPDSPGAEPTPAPTVPTYEKLGSYMFGEKEYGIYSAYFSVNEYNEILMFSPFRPDDKKTTFLQVAVHKELDGNTLDVAEFTQNYDYFLRYESPVFLYPENIAPQSGTIFVKRVGEDEFDVNIDVVFKDGTPLKLKYNGEFSESSAPEVE